MKLRKESRTWGNLVTCGGGNMDFRGVWSDKPANGPPRGR